MGSEMPFEPRFYQINARDQVIHNLENEHKNAFLVLLPTGMGKTLIAALIVEMLIERDFVAPDGKVLFLVQDRKLKHQLHDMMNQYGLSKHGHLYLLDEQKGVPAYMTRKHIALSKFIFATPILLMNSVVGKNPRIDRDALNAVSVVIIDEIFDVFAQSYGAKRPREETISYVERRFGGGRDFNQIVRNLKEELENREEAAGREYNEKGIADLLIREFESKNFRMNKKFEPILNLLGILSSDSKKIVVGLTASVSQETKIDLLKTTLGESRVAEIHPAGDDFEFFRPEYQLKQIRVFDDWVSEMDSVIGKVRHGSFSQLSKAYKLLTGKDRIPNDRILLFVSDLLSKKKLQNNLLGKLGNNTERMNSYLSHASAYLLMTVARQRLLESTLKSFSKFIEDIENKVLLTNGDFLLIRNQVRERMKEYLAAEGYTSEKEKRLLFWLGMMEKEDKKSLVMCRFVETTKHLAALAEANGISATFVHGAMDGATQFKQIRDFKEGRVKVLFASERLIEKGTDLPEADVGFYYGTTASLERYEQSLGRIRSNVSNVKTLYTIAYNQTSENEKSLKRDTMFLELLGKRLGTIFDSSTE
ncbi:MAG: DEAD/DEAH box helicase [Candidatus Thorarchaeota archaeon]|nr:DEAD/DEAH box helicase [Candidatus Thorarchaeota archaeon]